MMAHRSRYVLGVSLSVALASVMLACPSNPNVSTRDGSATKTGGPEGRSASIESVEKQMTDMQRSISRMTRRVDRMRSKVVNIDEDNLVADSRYQTHIIEVTSTDIRIDGETVDERDLSAYILTHAICSDSPKLIASPKAEYERIASVLEQLYEAGCPKIRISEEQ